MIFKNIMRLRSMSIQSQNELTELGKIAQDEKQDLDKISGYEKIVSQNLTRFEKEIMELEQETDTLYIKKLAPDLYKIQNYTLWALKKGLSIDQIKLNLMNKGWKDNELIQMVIDDTIKYTDYYHGKKGNVQIPSVKIEETTKIIKPVTVVTVNSIKGKETQKDTPKTVVKLETQKPIVKPVVKKLKPKKESAAKKTSSKKTKKSKDSLTDVETKLIKLKEDLTSEKKKGKK